MIEYTLSFRRLEGGVTQAHIHLGQARRSHDFPFSLHPSPELRGGSWKIGDRQMYDQGRLTVLDQPEVLAVAARYPDRPGLDGERWQ